ncbi:MAG: DUF2059 domain-containing protein [Hyphomicrobium sp.]
MMTRLLAVFMAALSIALCAPLRAEDAPAVAADPARIAAARDLLEVTGVSRQLDGMVDAMKAGFARGAKAESSEAGGKLSGEFDAAMQKLLRYKEDMITDFAGLYAETFTAEEMKTVADFYRSGAGAKFIEMTPELMKKGAVIGMKYSDKIVKEMAPAKPQ